MDQHLLSFVVRWIHVCSMALLLGGTLMLLALAVRSRTATAAEQSGSLAFAAQRYEWLFWLAIGIQLITGIGNLGAFGPNLPAPPSSWGVKLIVKLLLVLLLILFSLVRTLALALSARPRDETPATNTAALPLAAAQWRYGATALVLAVVVLLAVSLAHG